jgi:hypothetical protein
VQPYGDWRRSDFAVFLFEPGFDVVVAVAFVGLQPEFAGDFYFGFDAEVVDCDGAPEFLDLAEGVDEIVGEEMPRDDGGFLVEERTIAEGVVEEFDGLLEDAIGLAGIYFVGAGQVLEVGEDIGAENGPDEAEAEGEIDFEPAAIGGFLVELILGEKEKTEIAEAETVESHGVGFVILAEAAGTAGTGGEEDEIVGDGFFADLRDFFLEEIDEAAGGKDGGAAGAGVDEFLAGVEIGAGDVGKRLGFVVEIVEGALDDAFVFPGEAAVEDSDFVAVGALEGLGLVGGVMLGGRRRDGLSKGIDGDERCHGSLLLGARVTAVGWAEGGKSAPEFGGAQSLKNCADEQGG